MATPNNRKKKQPRALYKFGTLKTYYNESGTAKSKTEPHFISARISTIKALGIKVEPATNQDLYKADSNGNIDYYPTHRGSRFIRLYKEGGTNKTGEYQIPIPPTANRKHIVEFLKGSKVEYYQLEGRKYPFAPSAG